MTYFEAVAALHTAKQVYGYVRFTNDDGQNVKISKKSAANAILELKADGAESFNFTTAAGGLMLFMG